MSVFGFLNSKTDGVGFFLKKVSLYISTGTGLELLETGLRVPEITISGWRYLLPCESITTSVICPSLAIAEQFVSKANQSHVINWFKDLI